MYTGEGDDNQIQYLSVKSHGQEPGRPQSMKSQNSQEMSKRLKTKTNYIISRFYIDIPLQLSFFNLGTSDRINHNPSYIKSRIINLPQK